MYVLEITIINGATGESRLMKRQFDPTLAAATLATKWSGLAPAVQALVTDLLTAAATSEPPAI